jgi:hypothetical protein
MILTALDFILAFSTHHYIDKIVNPFKKANTETPARQLLEEIVVSPHAETLPSLFYYIPSPRHRHHGTYQGAGGTSYGTLHGTYPGTYSDTGQYHDTSSVERVSPAWLAFDRPQYHHWMTFRDYKF